VCAVAHFSSFRYKNIIAFSHKKHDELLYAKPYLSMNKLVMRAQQLHQLVLQTKPLPTHAQLLASARNPR
jgi:hypothetical protein